MASLTAYMLMERVNVPPEFKTPASYAYFGFAGPRVGNQEYADYWNRLKDKQVTRIVGHADIIPHLPLASLGYVHHGTELWITPDEDKSCSKEVYEDFSCSNSLGPAYIPSDHSTMWDVTHALECSINNPGSVLAQFAMPGELGNGLPTEKLLNN